MMKSGSRVIRFDKRYLSAFRTLNLDWIEKYFKVEAMDLYQLENPQTTILSKGGEIFFVLEGDQAVGTCAMVPHEVGGFELAKMAVSPLARGKGYGDLLMLAAIQWARMQKADYILILSNTLLEPAIKLYHKYGFEVLHLGTHPDYLRCNIEMRLDPL